MAYISKNNGYKYGIKTLAQLTGITGMQVGDTCFCTSNNRIMTYDGTFWMCDDFVIMINRSGATINQWDVVVAQRGSTATEIACTTTVSSVNDVRGNVVGVAVYSAANGANCVIAVKGNYSVNTSAGVTAGNPLRTSTTVAGKAVQDTSGGFPSTISGVFAVATETLAAAGTISCVIVATKEIF